MFIGKIRKFIFDTLFPKKCFGCTREGYYICPSCIEKIPRSDRVSMDILSVFKYKHPVVRRLLWNLKYNGRSGIAHEFGDYMSDTLISELEDSALYENMREIYLVPMPMSKERKKKRRENHAKTLAEAISKQTNFPIMDCLHKTRDTKRQALIKNRTKRLLNVKNSMELKTEFDIKGKNIVLVDDIVTTGGTIQEARRVLLSHGARKIIALVVAH